MAHDFLGNELSIGDDVVFLNYNGTSASLERGKITRVSEHTAEISGKRRAEYKIVKVNPVKSTMDNTWIPCSERLPERPGDYLVCTKNEYYGTKNVAKRYFNGDGWSGRWTNITHWMPLPEPAKEGENGNG